MKTKIKLIQLILILSVILSACNDKEKLPVADFMFENNQQGPVEVNFMNKSLHADSYIWDFGDGGFSNEENPTHYYLDPGEFTIRLKAIGADGHTFKEKNITITGTAYFVINRSPFTLNNVVTFYAEGDSVMDMIGFGNMLSNSRSVSVYTTRPEIHLAIQVSSTQFFYVANPYLMYSNKLNKMEFTEGTLGYVIKKGLSPKLKSMNSEKQIKLSDVLIDQ